MTDLPPAQKNTPFTLQTCSMAKAATLIGDRWKLLILRELFYNVRRFGDMQKDIAIPKSVLSNRLNALISDGMIAKTAYQDAGQRTRYEYVLTQAGHDFLIPLLALMQWGAVHGGGDVMVLPMRHHKSNAPVDIGFTCEGVALDLTQVRFSLPKSERKRPA